jgi:hypothetical protein
MVLSHGPLAEPHATDVKLLLEAHGRRVSFTTVDTAELQLVFKPKLLKKGQLPAKGGAPVVVLLNREMLPEGKDKGHFALTAAVLARDGGLTATVRCMAVSFRDLLVVCHRPLVLAVLALLCGGGTCQTMGPAAWGYN